MGFTAAMVFVGAVSGATIGAAASAITGGDPGQGASMGFFSGAATGGLGAAFGGPGGAAGGAPNAASAGTDAAANSGVATTSADGMTGALDPATQQGMAAGMSDMTPASTTAAIGPSDMGTAPFAQEAAAAPAGDPFAAVSPYDNLSALPSAAQTGMATPLDASMTFAQNGAPFMGIKNLAQSYLPQGAGQALTKQAMGGLFNAALGGGATTAPTEINNYIKGGNIQPLGMATPAAAGVVNPVTAALVNNSAANQPSNSTTPIQTVGQPINNNNTINNTTSDIGGNLAGTGTNYKPYQIPPLGSPLPFLLADQNIKTPTV